MGSKPDPAAPPTTKPLPSLPAMLPFATEPIIISPPPLVGAAAMDIGDTVRPPPPIIRIGRSGVVAVVVVPNSPPIVPLAVDCFCSVDNDGAAAAVAVDEDDNMFKESKAEYKSLQTHCC